MKNKGLIKICLIKDCIEFLYLYLYLYLLDVVVKEYCYLYLMEYGEYFFCFVCV